MRVEFEKRKRDLCMWTAYPAKRRPISSVGGGGIGRLPHDLAQFVVERALGHRYGFWGCIADGATFRSLERTGRRRTPQGKGVIRTHVAELDLAEHDANFHVGAWREGRPTPLCGELDDMLSAWTRLAEFDVITLEFPLRVGARR